MEVNIYCYLSAPAVEEHNVREYLEEFLSDISGILQVVARAFLIVWEKSDLAPEPNDLQHSFDEEGSLILPLSFQYSCLKQAYLRIELLKSLFENLAYKSGVCVDYEYHLDD